MKARARVLLKISGETLSLQHKEKTFDSTAVDYLTHEIGSVRGLCELAIVVGGGNIFRGSREGAALHMDLSVRDHAGMVATIVNGLILNDALTRRGFDARLMSSLEIKSVAEPYIRGRAIRHLEKGRIVVVASGLGVPGVTTDMAMIQRAFDINATLVLKGTKVDGVFDRDPHCYENAVLLPRLSCSDFLQRELSSILDSPAVSFARDKKMSIRVFNIFTPGNLERVVKEEDVGSIIYS